jgi:hypothetical protein
MSNVSVLSIHVFDEHLDLDGFQMLYIQLHPKLTLFAFDQVSFFPRFVKSALLSHPNKKAF